MTDKDLLVIISGLLRAQDRTSETLDKQAETLVQHAEILNQHLTSGKWILTSAFYKSWMI